MNTNTQTDQAGERTQWEPTHLKRWTRPKDYFGQEWYDYYSFIGQSRDSDALERSNFKCGLEQIGGEHGDNGEGELSVVVVRENHWAVGWVEWIAIHESDTESLQIADEIKANLADYPIVDESDFTETEMNEANEVWKDCYNVRDRIRYIREHRSQFDFMNLSDLLGCVRGKYFSGYASGLLQ